MKWYECIWKKPIKRWIVNDFDERAAKHLGRWQRQRARKWQSEWTRANDEKWGKKRKRLIPIKCNVYVIYGNNGLIIRLCNVAYLLLAFCAQWWDNSCFERASHTYMGNVFAAVVAALYQHRCRHRARFFRLIWCYAARAINSNSGSSILKNPYTHTISVLGMKIMANLLTMARWTHFNT